jgi:hypothetical protein
MKTRLIVAFLVVATALTGVIRHPGELRPVLTIRVANEARVESRTLNQAKNMAVKIFNHSGIDLVWMVCEIGQAVEDSIDPCQKERGPAEFWMYVTATKHPRTSSDMLGFTVLDDVTKDGWSGVYLPAAEQLASPTGARLGDILGAAMAHELGHLLLGAGSHIRASVMCPHWGPPELERISIGELLFSGDQAELLRKRIEGRAPGTISSSR